MRRVEAVGIALGVLLLVALPTIVHGWPTTLSGNLLTLFTISGGLALIWWRSQPRGAPVLALGLLLIAAGLDGWLPDSAIALWGLGFACLALGWSGPAAWLVALAAAAYLVPFDYLAQIDSWVATLMFTVPPYVAGTVLRLRRETSDQLTIRAQELEDERQLFAEIALRHERARIASELHDVVGHAISVMVIQAAAGQRLVDADPRRAREAFASISESARQGVKDLDLLIDLLGAREAGVSPVSGAGIGHSDDLRLVDEVVSRAGLSGLKVTCCFDGDRRLVSEPISHLAFRVVQEGLTNALRYAPGAEVRIMISLDGRRSLTVRVENDCAAGPGLSLVGTGRGLIGLRERISTFGGQLTAGATGPGGWAVEAWFPGR